MENANVDNKEDREDTSQEEDFIDVEAEPVEETQDEPTTEDITDNETITNSNSTVDEEAQADTDSESEGTEADTDSESEGTESDSESEEAETDSEEASDDKTNYRVYGRESAEDARKTAETMLSDVYATLRTKQKDWNKILADYRSAKPGVDLLEYEDRLVLKMDLPRVSKDDVTLKMSRESIDILVNFPECVDTDEKVKILRKERCSGRIKRVIPIPVEIDLNEVEAIFDKNELTIKMPKVKGKEVDVEIV